MINDSSNQTRTLAAAIDAAVIAAQRVASPANRMSFPDVTEDHVSPKMAAAVDGRATVPIFVDTLEEIPVLTETVAQETTMSEESQINTDASPAAFVSEDIPVTTLQQAVAAAFAASKTVQPVIKKAPKVLINGDYDLTMAMEAEAEYVTNRQAVLAKKAAEEAEALAKKSVKEPKEPKVKSELRIKAEDTFVAAGLSIERSYFRVREFVGYPVQPKVTPAEHLTRIKGHFQDVDRHLSAAALGARKVFSKQLAV